MILTISKLYANGFLKKYSVWMLGLFILIGLAGLAINRNSTPSENENSILQSHAFEPAALLSHAAIWHPVGDNALLFQPYDDSEPTRLFWMEGIPRQWNAFPIGSSDDSAHLVWLNTDGKLWYSQINPDGTPKLLALNLVSGDVRAMTATCLFDGNLVIIWQNERQALGMIWVDTLGRKIAEQTITTNATHFDLAADRKGALYLTWASTQQISILSFTTEAIGNLDIDDASHFDLSLPTSEWLDTLRILIDDKWVYVIWGINTAGNPQTTHFEVSPFLKSDIRPNVPLPEVAPFALMLVENDESIPLRWDGEVQNWDEPRAQLPLTAYLEQQWTAILLDFADGGYIGYEILFDQPANASQPRVLIWDGQWAAAWVRINADGQLVQEIMH
ncbi:MAG: hypothetical protein K8L91_11220 [Anaerolineae bacterium]|nr:hypothetical protein [Anaerolineae bacterium]